MPVSKGMLAATYNIFCRYYARHPYRGDEAPLPISMVILAATCLVIHYLDDWAPSSRWWALYYAGGLTAKVIEHAMMTVFAALDWNLHHVCKVEAVDSTVDMLFREPAVVAVVTDLEADGTSHAESSLPLQASAQSERLADTVWVNGQPTPQETPPDSAPESCRNSWVPLL